MGLKLGLPLCCAAPGRPLARNVRLKHRLRDSLFTAIFPNGSKEYRHTAPPAPRCAARRSPLHGALLPGGGAAGPAPRVERGGGRTAPRPGGTCGAPRPAWPPYGATAAVQRMVSCPQPRELCVSPAGRQNAKKPQKNKKNNQTNPKQTNRQQVFNLKEGEENTFRTGSRSREERICSEQSR